MGTTKLTGTVNQLLEVIQRKRGREAGIVSRGFSRHPLPTVRGEEQMTEWCRKAAADLRLVELAGRVTVRWNARLRSTAGRAWPSTGLIELNPRLAGIGDGEVERTMRHELAHLVAWARAGRKRIAPHGMEWCRACEDLGIPGERATHRLPLPRTRRAPRYFYACPECGMEYARVRPLSRASACLKCCREFSGGRYDRRFRLISK